MLLPWLAAVASAAELTINIEGLQRELRESVEANLSLRNYLNRDVTPAQVRRLFNTAEDEIRKGLEPFGYYNVQVSSTLETTDRGLTALFRVTPGEPVKVTSRKVEVHGDAALLDPVQAALRRFRPREGEVLNHEVYEESRERVEQSLLDNGFLRMKAKQRRVEVTRRANTADIMLEWESGPRMRFGEVNFSEAQFPQRFLERYIPWESGAYYSPEQLIAFQQRLVDADFFSTVAVQPNLQQADGVDVPIDVQLSPAKRTIYTAGAYISTDTGPGVKLGMQRRWVNSKGHKFQADIDYAQRLQAFSASYRIPLLGPNEKSLNFGITHRDEDTDTSKSKNDRIAINESRRWHGFTRTVGLQYLAGTFEIGQDNRFTRLLYGEATLTKKQADDFFFPRKGWSAGAAIRFAPELLISDTSFSQFTLDGKYVLGFGRRNRFITRLSFGAMAVDDFNQLPPELRFFAGGDRSIRGYDYQALGSTNDTGDVIGGTYLGVGSLELERYFFREWGAALFVDAGDAWLKGDFETNIGAGIGVRWRSPVGVVRVDFGYPVQSEVVTDKKVRFHVSIGPDI